MKQSILGLYFEDFLVGEEIKHSLSKLFLKVIIIFSLLTMNHHPVHTNLDYAGENQHGKILVGRYIGVFLSSWDDCSRY